MGREAFSDRLAILARTTADLISRLETFLEGQRKIENVFRATVTSSPGVPAVFGQDDDDRAYVAALAQEGKWLTIADLWLRGLSIPWEALPSLQSCRRVSLPTYPFAGTRHWIEWTPMNGAPGRLVSQAPTAARHDNQPAAELIGAARPDIHETFLHTLRDVLGMPHEGDATADAGTANRTPRSLGLDSLRAIELLGRLERAKSAWRCR